MGITNSPQGGQVLEVNTDVGDPDDATTDTLHGKIGTDTEMADISLFDMIGLVNATTTDGLQGKIGTDTEMDDNSLYDLLGGADAKTDGIATALAGTGGIATFPAAAVAGNAVSIAEVLRYVQETATEQLLTRASATTPQGAAAALFTIAGGNIELLSICGEVTTVLGGASNTKLTFNPTAAGTSTDICAVLDLATDAVGIFYSITGTFANAIARGAQNFISKTAASCRMANPITMGPGTIDLDCVGSVSGEIAWHIVYRKLEAAATVVTA